jgi:LDH2 family malate/lactate/ureidoglycolate dehydrogenase
MPETIDAGALRAFAAEVLRAAGLPEEPARAVAEGLVEADLLGHDTHGLALLADYVDEIAAGTMATDGRPEIVSSNGAATVWDANRLPGVWTTMLAIDEAVKRAKIFGVGAVALRRSHHIACLAVYLERAARDGMVVLVLSSDPSAAHVAPFGGTSPVTTPNPLAAGFPTGGDPVLLDVSMSITTAAMVGRTRAAGGRLRGPWLIEPDGTATDDPDALKRGGAILPIGGTDHGHKGFALSLLVEALTQGLGGYGRAEAPTEWGASVLVLAFDPALFGGADAFTRQTGWLADKARAANPMPGGTPIRLPGEAGFSRKRDRLAGGIPLRADIRESLAGLAARFSLTAPMPA